MIASSFTDPVLGVDVHFEMVPTPAPVPTPIPNPFTGVVFDPVGLAVGLAMGAAVSAVLGAPVQGPVLYWTAFPATNTGTEAKHIPGHILIPPGTAWAPFPKTPKPVIHPGETPSPANPVVPENDAVMIFGSKTVTVMGSNACRLGDIALSCGEPVRLPSSVVLAVPKGAPILIGGPPSLDILAALMASLRTRFISDSLHAALSRLKPSRFRNLMHRAVCFLTGHPVDVASGKVLTEAVEVELPGPMPLKIERVYSSAFASRGGMLGHGWGFSLEQKIWRERGRVVLLAEDGREIEFDTFDFADHRIEPGGRVYNAVEGLTLHCEAAGTWRVVERSGLSRVFAPVPGGPREQAPIQSIRSSCGFFTTKFHYDANGRLQAVTDASGRIVRLRVDPAGRLQELHLPTPDGGRHYCHRRYDYDDHGDLTRVDDPDGQSWRFEYQAHLLVRETDRLGLSFYFQYDGTGEDAWCVRTWGDDGLYDHVINYDKKGRATFVTDSLGNLTQYHMNLVGQVVKIVGPLGGERSFEYDPVTLQRTAEVDELGRTAEFAYDARGNLERATLPDGGVMEITHDAQGRMLAAVDPQGGNWSWDYDRYGRLTTRRACDGSQTAYRYDHGNLVEVIDAAGRRTTMEYDDQGMVVGVRGPDGATSRWRYDALGREVVAEDARGETTRFRFDVHGRLQTIVEADGNQRRLSYDAEGNLVRALDGTNDVSFAYRGLGRLVSRTEAGTVVQFEYDTEEYLRAIVTEDGARYTFELDERHQVRAEIGFDGKRRSYERDAAGQVVAVMRASGRKSLYTHDAMGRIAAIEHDDGTGATFEYRANGGMVRATNDACTIRFERDSVGRIVTESRGEHWVRSVRDPTGTRKRLESSLGATVAVERDAAGRTTGVQCWTDGAPAGATPGGSDWQAQIRRDVMGLEVERTLPGGVHSKWSRDRLGRPTQHQIWTSKATHRDARYQWRLDSRLESMVEGRRGLSVRYGHDARGYLAWAQYGDRRVDLRVPDAVGNLFRRNDRADRRYGPSGELLAAMTADGERRYVYDDDGNLVERHEPDGTVWRFEWSVDGTLRAVERPDGKRVEHVYDALGRRIAKRFDGKTTHWLWDGNVPLHEWEESSSETAEAEAELAPDDPHGGDQAATSTHDTSPRGPPGLVTTWLFEPSTYRPMAKLVGGRRYSIITDLAGTPVAMADETGAFVWSAELDIYGALEQVETAEGYDRHACPFRRAGQYEDAETGLYYNRHRHYDPAMGHYISRDPMMLRGSPTMYGYTADPLVQIDPEGLHQVFAWLEDAKGNQEFLPGPGRDGTWPSTSRGSRVATPMGTRGHSEFHLLTAMEGDPRLSGRTLVISSVGQEVSRGRRTLSPMDPCGPCDDAMRAFADRNNTSVEYRWHDDNGLQKRCYP